MNTKGAIKNGQSEKNWQHWAHKTQSERTTNDGAYYLGAAAICLLLFT
jgi:hypothetical protein